MQTTSSSRSTLLAAALSAAVGAAVLMPAAAPAQTMPAAQLPSIAVQQAVTVTAPDAKRYPGRVVSPESVEVTARVTAEILSREFAEGARVKKGDVLYRLDRTRYEAAVQSAQAELDEAKATAAWAQTNLERYSALIKQKATSRELYDDAVRQNRTAKASVAKAQAQLVLAQDDLKHTVVTSPIDGRAGVSELAAGNWIAAVGQKLTDVVATDPVRVRFALSLKDVIGDFGSLANLLTRSTVGLEKADGSRYGLAGKVAFADNSAVADTDTVDVYAEFANPDEELTVQSTVAVLLSPVLSTPKCAVLPSAVGYDTQGARVWVIADGKATRRSVVTGARAGIYQVIESGLEAGETVAVEGTHKLSEGQAVRIVTSGGAPEAPAGKGN